MSTSTTGSYAVKRVIESPLGDTITMQRRLQEHEGVITLVEDITIEALTLVDDKGSSNYHGKTWP